jgi:hypothetical protein
MRHESSKNSYFFSFFSMMAGALPSANGFFWEGGTEK